MQLLATWLVAFQAIRLDGGRCFKGVHLSQVHQQSYQVPNKTVKCTYFLSVVNIPNWLVQLRQLHPLRKALRNRNKKPPDMWLCPAAIHYYIRFLKGVHLSQVHQQSNIEVIPAWMVHLRQVHPLKIPLKTPAYFTIFLPPTT